MTENFVKLHWILQIDLHRFDEKICEIYYCKLIVCIWFDGKISWNGILQLDLHCVWFDEKIRGSEYCKSVVFRDTRWTSNRWEGFHVIILSFTHFQSIWRKFGINFLAFPRNFSFRPIRQSRQNIQYSVVYYKYFNAQIKPQMPVFFLKIYFSNLFRNDISISGV